MKADVTSELRVVSSRSTSARRGHALAVCAGIGLLVILTTGCHYLRSPHAEPHYGRLEQACFGYEPTVWRALPGGCEQAVRMIPDEVVQLPAATPPKAQPATEPEFGEEVPREPDAAPKTESTAPDESRVPGVIRGILEGATPPAAEPALPTAPPAAPQGPAPVPPAATPPQVEPTPPPSANPILPPAVEPATPPAAVETPSDLRQSRTRQVRPVSAASGEPIGRQAPDRAAQDLFRTVEHALAVTPTDDAVRQTRQDGKRQVVVEPAPKTPSAAPGTIGLAKFIY